MRHWTRIALTSFALVAVAIGVFAYGLLKPATGQDVESDFSGGGDFTFLVIGDQGVGNLRQWRVADAMARRAEATQVDAVFLLGDNFYRHGVESPEDLQWRYKFENVYSDALAATPFFATLGNHDYYGNEMAQIAYDAEDQGSGRWQMPARDYLQTFGGDPWQRLVRVAFIDTGLYMRNPEDSVKQLDKLLSQSAPATWTLVVTHAPLVSGNELAHWPGAAENIWLPVLTKHRVDAVLAGHDHNMQLIDRSGWPTSVILGVGGESGQTLENGDVPGLAFFANTTGFGALKVSREAMMLQFVGIDDEILFEHSLSR